MEGTSAGGSEGSKEKTGSESELTKKKVPELKQLLRDKGLKVSGKKADLIARLRGEEPSGEKKPRAQKNSKRKQPEMEEDDEEGDEDDDPPPVTEKRQRQPSRSEMQLPPLYPRQPSSLTSGEHSSSPQGSPSQYGQGLSQGQSLGLGLTQSQQSLSGFAQGLNQGTLAGFSLGLGSSFNQLNPAFNLGGIGGISDVSTLGGMNFLGQSDLTGGTPFFMDGAESQSLAPVEPLEGKCDLCKQMAGPYESENGELHIITCDQPVGCGRVIGKFCEACREGDNDDLGHVYAKYCETKHGGLCDNCAKLCNCPEPIPTTSFPTGFEGDGPFADPELAQYAREGSGPPLEEGPRADLSYGDSGDVEGDDDGDGDDDDGDLPGEEDFE